MPKKKVQIITVADMTPAFLQFTILLDMVKGLQLNGIGIDAATTGLQADAQFSGQPYQA